MPELPAILDRQIALVETANLDALLTCFHSDAVYLRPGVAADGPDELRAFFDGYLSVRPRIVKVMSVESTDDLVCYHAEVSTDVLTQQVVGTIVVRDGLIWRQTVMPVH